MNGEAEVTDEQMVQCFGKQKNCDRNCRLKAVCLGKKREEEQERRCKKYQEANYIDEMDAEKNHSAVEFQQEQSNSSEPEVSEEEIFRAIDELDVSESCRKELRKIHQAKIQKESTDEAIRELIRKMGEMYIHDPTGFEVLFFQILAGGNQKQLAEKRGCSKQNINKIIANGKKRLVAYREMIALKPECRLSEKEIAVIHAIAIKGMTYRQTAAIMGCSFRTIGNIAQRLRSKGIKLHKKRKGMRNATEKATTAAD